jgi:ubiquinone/menaquinone biosynthesis C-methylase UbiE
MVEEVDRSFGLINSMCTRIMGFDHSPLRAGLDIIARTGSLAILDVGCGTGRGMVEFGQKVCKLAKCDPAAVTGVGVSLNDLRGYSRSPAVAEAFESGQYTYVLGQGESMPYVETAGFDVAISYDGLIYSKDPRAWAREMRRATGPGGVVMFDARPGQSEPNSPLMHEVRSWQREGCDMAVEPTVVVHDGLAYAVTWFWAGVPAEAPAG